MVIESLLGLPAFLVYFGIGIVAVLLFGFVYTKVTPHCEWQLMRENNTAAAVAFSGTLIGYSLALASAAKSSVSALDFVIWALIALVAQLITFFLVRLFMPNLTERLNKGELASGIFLATASVVVGLLNAASMSY